MSAFNNLRILHKLQLALLYCFEGEFLDRLTPEAVVAKEACAFI